MEPFVYYLPSHLNSRILRQKMPEDSGYHFVLDTGEFLSAVILDTFENSLFSAGKLLLQVASKIVLLDLSTGYVSEQVGGAENVVVDDLPTGTVAAVLRAIARYRALLPIAKVQVRREEGSILDDENKTVVRLHHLTFGRGKQRMVGIGSVQYFLGYTEVFLDFCRWLQELGALPCSTTEALYAGLAIRRSEYCAKPEIALLSTKPVKESAIAIVDTFLQVARQNEAGIIADIDTEFLHDFRVSLRKVRSVLSLFTGVFAGQQTEFVKEKLAAIMRATNGLRDMDVYLMKREEYYQLVPLSAHGGLALLFEEFSHRRKGEQKKLTIMLQSKNYSNLMTRLARVLHDGRKIKDGPKAMNVSYAFACHMILKRYKKVCKTGRNLDENTPDPVIHRLRIHCKKLRYLIESFAPLFPAQEIRQFIKSLKMLQDTLGNFNDYSVQQQFLGKFLVSEPQTGAKALAITYAVGALSAMLHHLQKEERGRIIENLALFDSREIREAAKELFAQVEKRHEDNSLLQQ